MGYRDEELAPRAADRPTTWWERYLEVLSRDVSPTSRDVIERDSTFIAERCLPPAASTQWPATRVRKGLVMGAVQSGKTASMIAVAAQAVDRGVDMVVVLSGTRTALWRQTFDRLQAQLDRGRRSDRVWIPRRMSDGGAQGSAEHYKMQPPAVRKAIQTNKPIFVVAMKQTEHLAQLRREIHTTVLPVVEREGRPFHLLVIDDEADDASVIDARAEAPKDPKQIPRRIVDLWDGRPHTGATASDHLYATYMGYTATPQANLLQEDYNPLAPTDFVVSLRTAGPEGAIEPRQPTYTEPLGVKGYYTGGDLFYERLPQLCIDTDDCSQGAGLTGDTATAECLAPELQSGLKAFLVACAVRFMRERGETLSPAVAEETVFASEEDVRERMMGSSSMLVHPSAVMGDHFETAYQILGWASGRGTAEEERCFSAGDRRLLGTAGVQRSMEEEPGSWKRWLTSYQETSESLAAMTGARPREVPAAERWSDVRDVILKDILPATRLAVVNSDERSDERPLYTPVQDEQGWRAPRDAVTIFVSGSVMARGLTLEGLLTTVFTRRSGSPAADTQMQMQRWFGYRGKVLDLCRVFLTREQRELFTRFHQDDLALRRQILAQMEDDGGPPDALTVLQSYAYVATSKVSNVRTVPLAPRAHPFFPRVQDVGAQSEFTERLLELFGEPSRLDLEVDSRKALFSRQELSLREAAELLDSMRFAGYSPGSRSSSGDRWAGVERLLGSNRNVYGLYRPPSEGLGDPSENGCPYWTAAYLRLWAACLEAPAAGMYRKPDGARWNLLNVEELRAVAPVFRVGLRMVTGGTVLSRGPLRGVPVDLPMGQRAVVNGLVAGGWGSHNASDAGVGGDEYLDLLVRGEPLPGRLEASNPPRPPGFPGMLLFHLVDTPGGPGVVVGASVPEGGPEQLAAVVGGTDEEHE